MTQIADPLLLRVVSLVAPFRYILIEDVRLTFKALSDRNFQIRNLKFENVHFLAQSGAVRFETFGIRFCALGLADLLCQRVPSRLPLLKLRNR